MTERHTTDGRIPLDEDAAAAYRERREALHAAVSDLEAQLDDLESQGEPDREQLAAALRELRSQLERHVEEADAPSGLLAQINDTAPWFAPRTDQLRDEHAQLLERTDELLRATTDPVDAEPLLAQVRDLAGQVTEHRHRGTTLLMDAYMLDVSAGD